jgi:hypothetical protein
MPAWSGVRGGFGLCAKALNKSDLVDALYAKCDALVRKENIELVISALGTVLKEEVLLEGNESKYYSLQETPTILCFTNVHY